MKEEIQRNGNRNISFKKIFLIILIILLVIFVITTITNISYAKQDKTPIFYLSKTVNEVDSSVIYNVFPYKITNYKNRVNSDSYIEVSLFFKRYRNQFYDPESSKYIFEVGEYKPPVFDINKHISLIDDVISKVNTDGFSLGTNSNYSKIYIDTFLSDDNRTKLISGVNNEIAKKYPNKSIIFKTLESLKNDNIFKDDKIIDGIYIKVAILETREDEDVMSMEIITNVSSVFSQKVVLENKTPIVFKYSDDFDEQERKRILNEEKDKIAREAAIKQQEEERKKRDLEEKQRLEQEKQQKINEYNKKQDRLNFLLKTSNLVILDGKKGFIKTNTEKTILNENKDLNNINSYNIIRINNSKIMYFYQEQIKNNVAINVYIKEKQLTDNEFNYIINEINNMTGYSGVGKYQNSFVINISYLGRNKNILLKDLNEILKKYEMSI